MKNILSFPAFMLLMLTACSKPQPPKYLGYSNVRLEKASLANSVVAADLRFYNPNRYALQLKEADMDVFLNDKKVGHSRVDSLLTLPGRDTSAVPLRVQVAARDMMGPMAQVLLNPNVRLRLKGTARVGRSGVFVNMPVDYEATQRIELSQLDSLLEAGTDALSFSKGHMHMDTLDGFCFHAVPNHPVWKALPWEWYFV